MQHSVTVTPALLACASARFWAPSIEKENLIAAYLEQTVPFDTLGHKNTLPPVQCIASMLCHHRGVHAVALQVSLVSYSSVCMSA